MPRYHFDLLNSLGFTCDEEGAELPDVKTARSEAVRQARPIMAEEVCDGKLDLTGKIIVRCDGEQILELRFDSAVELVLPDDWNGA